MGKKSYLDSSCCLLVIIDVLEARNLAVVGSTANTSGYSDPYCKVSIKGTKFSAKTQYIEQNLNPQWSESFEYTVRDPSVSEIEFEIFDKEFGSKDVPMGKTSFSFKGMEPGSKVTRTLKLDKGELSVGISIEEGGIDSKQAKEIEKNILAECKGKKWEDPDFGANNSSLFVNASQPQHDTDDIEWKRPSEYCSEKKTQLFVEGVEAGDVIQGELGDCYFLGAISTLATRPELLKPIFVSSHPEAGFYQLKFFKNSEWQVVTIDDRIPTRRNRPIYASCKDSSETWVPLIEKAYAKLHGSYQALTGGLTGNALTDLTGEFSSTFQFKNIQDRISSGEWWKKMLWFTKEEYLMSAACNSSNANETEHDNGMGILKNHAYGILGCKEPKQGLQLVSLRNPWGQMEWKGDYSDKSDKWTPELRKACDAKDEEDGIFWMTYQDWARNYNTMNVLRLLQDQVGEKWHRYTFHGAWRGLTAGGCTNFATWNKNPQFGFRTKKATKIFVAISQPDRRMRNQGNKYPIAISFSIMKHDDLSRPKLTKTNADEIGDTPFSPSREVTQEFDLEANSSFIVMPSTFNPKEETRFWINIFSQEPLADVEEILPIKPQTVRGELRGKSAGGCANNDTWVNNPVFVVDAPNSPSFPVKLSINVVQEKKDNLLHMGIYCGKYSGQRPSKYDEITKERQCVNAPIVALDVELKKDDLPMWIMPHCFYAEKETKFDLTLYARSGFTFKQLQ